MEYHTPTSHIDVALKYFHQKCNPPRVIVDNASSKKITLIKVDSVNKRGCLLNIVEVLVDLNLVINKAYIASDGGWFMDVFHVTDELGNKVYEDTISEQIQQVDIASFTTATAPASAVKFCRQPHPYVVQTSLRPREQSMESIDKHLGHQPNVEHTTIELSGRDRPGLLSEIFVILNDLKCNVLAAVMWTHNCRMASIVHITDEFNAAPIDDPIRLDNILQLLHYVLKGNGDKQCAKSVVGDGSTHTERRLHQIMYADRDYVNVELDCEGNGWCKPFVTTEDCVEKDYSVLNVSCQDRPKLIFDTVCTITDMEYAIFHGIVTTEGQVAQQEYFIRHIDGSPINSEPERERVIHCLEAAIKRRSYEGIRLEMCGDDRVGLLADVTRIFREYGLTVKRAEVRTKDTQAVNVFYVADTSGYPVRSETIEAIKKEIGMNVLIVKDETVPTSRPQQTPLLLLGSIFRSRSEKILYNLGLIKSLPSEI